MKLKYVGRYSDVYIKGVGGVKRGEEIEIQNEIGKTLIERQPSEWKVANKTKNTKREDKK